MKQYLDLLRDTIDHGRVKSDRTGTGTISRFGGQVRYDMADGFPLVTTKKLHTNSVIAELLWFLSGSTNVKDLQAMGCTIWDEWAQDDGTIGPMYGYQWRDGGHWNGDQIANLVHSLRDDPDSRRHIVSAWNVADLPDMALAPCHAMFQCYCEELTEHERLRAATDDHLSKLLSIRTMTALNMDQAGVPRHRLSLHLYQRSADLFLGVPFNVASYSLLLHMLAQQCNMVPGEFIHSFGDQHIYSNHIEQVQTQLARQPRQLPMLHIKRKPASIFDYTPEDFEFLGYNPHPAIKAPVAV